MAMKSFAKVIADPKKAEVLVARSQSILPYSLLYSRILWFSIAFCVIVMATPFMMFPYVAYLTTHPPWYSFDVALVPDGPLPIIPNTSRSYKVLGGKVHDPLIDFGLPFENVTFESARPKERTQVTLRGWHVPHREGGHGVKVGIVAVHGGGRDRREFLSQVGYWHAAGLSVLLYDSSDHGLSDGTGIGLGFAVREQYDCIGAVRFAKAKLGWEKVVVIGTSVGGATVILASAQEPIVDVVISENPFYDYVPFFNKIYGDILGRGSFGGRDASKYGLLVNFFLSLTDYIPDSFIDHLANFTSWYIGASGKEGPLHVIKNISPRPILLIHGKKDTMIPFQHSILLHQTATEPKALWLADDGRHADIHSIYLQEYETKVIDFIYKSLNLKPKTAEAA